MSGLPTKPTKNGHEKHGLVLEIISLFLLVGIIYFGVKGFLILAFQATSPMMGVSSGSMTHLNEAWKQYYEEKGHNASQFPFKEGLQRGNLVFIRGVHSPEDIDIGDVIVWQEDGKRIIHRVAEIENDSNGQYFRTKGDRNLVLDGRKIRLQDVVGEAIFSLPYLGYPSILV